jgi:nucleoside-diphosphate-sugar epimerase
MNFTKQEVAEKIKAKVDFYLHFAEIGEDADKRNYFVSYKKINDLGFKTEIDIDTGIDELIKGMELINISSKYYNV